MNDLQLADYQPADGFIRINYTDERPTVSARDLHDFLEVDTPYRIWFPRMCEYGFTDGQDFCTFLYESTGGRRATDAYLSIDMAKEICMLQRNEKGKIARQYFLQIEKAWNSPEQVFARALKFANKQIEQLNQTVSMQAKQIEADRPKVEFADAVSGSPDSILVGQLAKILRQNGIQIGPIRLFRWFREAGYLSKRAGDNFNINSRGVPHLYRWREESAKKTLNNRWNIRSVFGIM